MTHDELADRLEALASNLQSIHDTQEKIGVSVGLIALRQQIKDVDALATEARALGAEHQQYVNAQGHSFLRHWPS